MKEKILSFKKFFNDTNTDNSLNETSRIKADPRAIPKPPAKKTPAITAYDILANEIAKEKGITRDQVNGVLYKIAWHETGKTLDPKQKQLGGGPGRGLYQYEPPSIKTALSRMDNYLRKKGKTAPKWIAFFKKNLDVTKLSPKRQSYLALIDMLERSNFNFKKAATTDKELAEQWGKGWQTGNSSKKKKKFLSELPLFYQHKSANKVKYLEPPV
jgi:hypothetical protein